MSTESKLVILVFLSFAVLGCNPATSQPKEAQPEATDLDNPPAPDAAEPLDDGTNDAAYFRRGRRRRGPGPIGPGNGGMGGRRADMTTLHAMFAARDKIARTVTILLDGATATTESDDPEIAALIRDHVPAMEDRVHENNPLPPMTFHPVFTALIKHADDYSLDYEETPKGIRVTYQAVDPYVVMLVQEHAKLVSRFIRNGMQEVHKPYTLPILDAKSEGNPVNKLKVSANDAKAIP